ncbi:MAG: sec-independent protein translocase protein TatA [Luteibaculaceae bacterium]|jgi:sec-independent protein translocase protein TatA
MMMTPFLFFNISGGEILVVLVFVLMFFGSKRIPDIARTLGKTIRQVKDATQGIQNDIRDSVSDVKKELDVKDKFKNDL